MANGVEFDEDKASYRRPMSGGIPNAGGGFSSPPTSGMSGWLMRHGLAKSGTSAQIILIGVVIINVAIIYVVIKYLL